MGITSPIINQYIKLDKMRMQTFKNKFKVDQNVHELMQKEFRHIASRKSESIM